MKIFNTNNNKSWAIRLCKNEFNNYVTITACDRFTGEKICDLITFYESGDVYLMEKAKECLLDNEYDPNEHNNNFDELGRIIIKKGE